MAAAATSLDNTKFEELCRLCATKTTMVLSVNIFEGEGPIRQLSKKIHACLQLQVHVEDELPKLICEECLYKLEMFYDFQDRSLRTERLLIELCKQFKAITNSLPSEQHCVVSVDQHGLIMVPHYQLPVDNIQNVAPDIQVPQMSTGGILIGHEIILHHQSDLHQHNLDVIGINNQNLATQDLSNHSLQSMHGQESIVVASNDNARFDDDNLNLMQHHLLNEQFRLQHGISMTDENAVNGYQLTNEIKDNLTRTTDQNYHHDSSETPLSSIDYPNSKVVDATLNDDSLGVEVNSHLNGMISYSSDSQMDQLRQDDSNGGTNLLNEDVFYNDNTQIGVFVCSLCGKTFGEKVVFERHYETHFFKCENCLLAFASEEALGSHRKACSGTDDDQNSNESVKIDDPKVEEEEHSVVKSENDLSNDFTSNLTNSCVIKLQNGDESNDNFSLCAGENSQNESTKQSKSLASKECKECGKVYKTNYKLQEHMRKHTGEAPYKCKSCEKAFRSKIGLAQHEAKHTGQYDFACQICGKGFQCKSYLMVHQRVHSDIKPYPCTTCGQNFKTKQSLLDHTNRHFGVKPYMCEICGRGFITKGLCRAHEKIHSGTDNRKYSCKICNKRFVSKSYLQTHQKIHTGEKPFMCEVCGKGFLTRVDLKIHSTMHTGEKSYVCEICGKAFARRDALRCHRRCHTGERPYSCDLCGQTFTQFTPMAIHKRLHTGERPYSCETCGKTFVSRSTMMSHAKKHVKSEEERPKPEPVENT